MISSPRQPQKHAGASEPPAIVIASSALVAALGVSTADQRQQRQPQPFPEQQQEPFPEPPPRQQPTPSQQQQPPTFKSNVNAVLVDVRIVDGDGHFVPEITRDDLKIFEDGHEQTITTFERVDIPIHPDERPLFAGKPVDADVASNGGAEGRLYILLLDDYHTHTFPLADGARAPQKGIHRAAFHRSRSRRGADHEWAREDGAGVHE